MDRTAGSSIDSHEILVVEDSPTQAEKLNHLLQKQGYRTRVAKNGGEALSLLQELRPSLVITDVLMPMMNGYELCAAIKNQERLRDIPVILLTSLSDPKDVLEALKCGANNFITKPYDDSYLLSHIRYILASTETLKSDKLKMGIEISVGGSTHYISSDRQQIFDFLLATYDSYDRKNRELLRTTEQLRELNEHLEEKVRERTEAIEEARNRYHMLFEQSPFGVVIIAPETGRAVEFNETAHRQLGYSRDEFASLTIADYEAKEKPKEIEEKIREIMMGGKFDFQTSHRTREGEIRDVLVTAQAIKLLNRTVMHTVYQDITEKKKAERALEQSTEQLRQSQRIEAVGRLAGGIAHDFNNLLTVITGYCELMMAKIGKGNPLLQDVREISKSADRAAALTRQLLAFSRRQVLQPKVLDINSVVTGIDKMLRRLLGEDISLVTVLDGVGGKVMADPGQIEQVIVNLAVNARDAMPDGGTITIETAANVELDDAYARTHGGASPGPHVMLAVSDTGCGMDAETLSRVFEPFFTTKEKGKGTGLGLSTVYGIVKQSGGCIYAYSEPGSGTAMKIYLPCVTGDAVREDDERESESGDRLHGSETILLVEDEETLRKLASEILQANGYTVLAAENGEEALRRLHNSPGIPNLLVTDVVMPRMGGRELSDRIKAVYPGTRVLYMSGYTDNAIVHHGVLDPGVSYLQKPFSPKTLARKVREVLDANAVR
ncbi:MAG: response regulator [Deltaproteobacteria bacterium]|nr:response regulator [Deltaproteobacteria bacterium]MDA8179431.1 response regulator [Deltaproteobacteria bacterium]